MTERYVHQSTPIQECRSHTHFAPTCSCHYSTALHSASTMTFNTTHTHSRACTTTHTHTRTHTHTHTHIHMHMHKHKHTHTYIQVCHTDLHQPLLHSSPRFHSIHCDLEWHLLPLHAVHGCDDKLVIEVQVINGTKTLFEVRLYASGILRMVLSKHTD